MIPFLFFSLHVCKKGGLLRGIFEAFFFAFFAAFFFFGGKHFCAGQGFFLVTYGTSYLAWPCLVSIGHA